MTRVFGPILGPPAPPSRSGPLPIRRPFSGPHRERFRNAPAICLRADPASQQSVPDRHRSACPIAAWPIREAFSICLLLGLNSYSQFSSFVKLPHLGWLMTRALRIPCSLCQLFKVFAKTDGSPCKPCVVVGAVSAIGWLAYYRDECRVSVRKAGNLA